jgi:nitrite reductase (NADH) large subunit
MAPPVLLPMVGDFVTPGPPSVSVLAAVAAVLAPTVVSAALYVLVAFALRASNDRRRRTLAGAFAATAFALLYVFSAPRILALFGVDQPGAVAAFRAVACAAALSWWVWNQSRAAPRPSAQVWLGAPGGPLHREETLVRFIGADGSRRPVAVGIGESLAVAARRAGVGVPGGCGVGTCGADPLMVLTGRHNLSGPTPEEQATLRRFGMPASTRLACVARVTGEVTVTPHAPATVPPAEVNPSIRNVVIVGDGIAGLTAAEHVRRLHSGCEVVLVGREPDHTYNRMALTDLVMADSELTDLGLLPEDWFDEHGITAPVGVQAVRLDVAAHELTLDNGDRLRYSRLILATGAAPVQPPIDGLPLAGVHLMRTAEDAIAARAETEGHPDLRTVIVLGAGPLGVETATALTGLGVPVTLVDRKPWPLPGLVDERAGEMVRAELDALGVTVETGVTVRQVYGASRVAAVGLSDGRQLPCDVLLICPGVRPNVELARAAGLAVQRGVIVDATMRTSHPHVFAVGDVAEFGTKVTGLWYAAVEQATVAAEQAVARVPSEGRQYRPGPAVTRLHLPGVQVVAIGRTEPQHDDHAVIVLDEPAPRQYRKIIVAADGTVPGGIVVNDPEAVAAIESAATGGVDARPLLAEVRAGDLMTLTTATTRRPIRDRLVWLGEAAGVAVASLAIVAAGALLTRTLLDGRPASAPTTSAVESPRPFSSSSPGRTPGQASPGPASAAPSADGRVADVLAHPRIRWSAEAQRTLVAGGADARLLALLVTLAADHEITVAALPEVPGARTNGARRAVAITAVDGVPLSGRQADEIAGWFNAQQEPYRPVAVLITSGNSPALFVALEPTRPATP